MMRITTRVWVAVFALAISPISLEAQRRDGPGSTAKSIDQAQLGPVQVLLRERAKLALTAEQIARLQEVDRQMEEKNRPFVSQLLQIRRQLPPQSRRGTEPTPEQREAYREQMRAAKPLLEKIWENNRDSMRQIGEILTPDQKERVRDILHGDKNSNGDSDRRRFDGNRN